MEDSVIRFRVQKMKRSEMHKAFIIEELITLTITAFVYLLDDWTLIMCIEFFFFLTIVLVLRWTVLLHNDEWPYEIEIHDDKVILHNQSFFKETAWAIDKSRLTVIHYYWLNAKGTSVLELRKRKNWNGLRLSTEYFWTKEMQLEILRILKERKIGTIYYREVPWSNPFKIGQGQNK